MAISSVWVLVERNRNEEVLIGASDDEDYTKKVRDAYRLLHPNKTYFVECIDFVEGRFVKP